IFWRAVRRPAPRPRITAPTPRLSWGPIPSGGWWGPRRWPAGRRRDGRERPRRLRRPPAVILGRLLPIPGQRPPPYSASGPPTRRAAPGGSGVGRLVQHVPP